MSKPIHSMPKEGSRQLHGDNSPSSIAPSCDGGPRGEDLCCWLSHRFSLCSHIDGSPTEGRGPARPIHDAAEEIFFLLGEFN